MKSKLPLVILFLISAIFSLGCSDAKDQKGDYQEAPKMVKTQTVSLFDGKIQRHITGRLQAAQNTSLSFEVNGVLSSISVNLGETFLQGEVLAQLDTKLYKLAVAQREGQLGEAQASRAEAKQTLDRNLALKEQNLVSQAVVDNAQAAYNIASERVNSAQSALNIAKQNLRDTTLFAPYNGTVSARMVEPNQQITTQSSILSIQGEANLEVAAVVPESVIGRLSLTSQVQVLIPALNSKPQDATKYMATLTEIGQQASVANAFPITVTFNQAYPQLLPGMSAEIILPLKGLSQSDVSEELSALYQIPLTAIATDEKGQYVLSVINHDGQYKSQKEYITIVQSLAKAVIVRFNNKPSQMNTEIEVISAGVAFIQDQQLVTPLSRSQLIYNQ